MKVVVIGSGLIGATAAYFLACRGYEVSVFDRQDGPGRETSFANGALLHPSMPEPWNTPGCWRVLLRSLYRSDTALKLRLRSLPDMAGWGVTFLRNSAPETFERNTLSNLRLARYSLEVMHSQRHQWNLEYGRIAVGSLRIFRDPRAMVQALASANRRLSEGLRFRRLSSAEVIQLEPALASTAGQLVGGIHYESDEIGDAYRFCVALVSLAQRLGATFHFGTDVLALERRGDRVTAAVSKHGRFEADSYVVAAGSYSRFLLRQLDIGLPIRPAKGYSVTFNNCPDDSRSLSIPIIDDQLHAAMVPLANTIRVAGTAEFAGYDVSLRAERVRNLTTLLKTVLPQSQFDAASARPWCGLRPMSADGVPIIGCTAFENLWVSTGHGHLGWTMAAGSGQLLTDLMSGDRPPKIDAAPYALTRFA